VGPLTDALIAGELVPAIEAGESALGFEVLVVLCDHLSATAD